MMNFWLIFVVLGLCVGDGYWDIQLSPQSITSVPFGDGHISVWEHAQTRGRYYAMPLVHLLHQTAYTLENIVTGEVEMSFEVLMWSLEARETVYRHLKSHVNASISQEQVELLPMEKIRIVWKDRNRPLSSNIRLTDQWRSNTHLPTTVTFQFVCQDSETCSSLQSAMRTRPIMFNALEIEYIINGQRSSRRVTTVTGSHLVRGKLYTKLANMPVQSGQRYLSSADVKTVTSETVTNLLSRVVTDSDYVDTGDEVSVMNVLQSVLQRQQVSTESFQPRMWESVFWDPSFARPDKFTKYLNRVLSKDTSDSRKFLLDESQRSTSAEGSVGISFLDIGTKASVGASDSSQSKVQKEDVLNTLHERHSNIEWAGEQFRVKPMKLFRLNLATLNTSTNIASASIQVRRYETVQSIKLRVSNNTQTPSLTPQLVQARLREELNELSLRISTADRGWKAKFETIGRVLNAWPDWCYVANRDCGGRELRRFHGSLDHCRSQCNVDCRCKSFQHRGNECWLKHANCEIGQLMPDPDMDYYYKVTRSPVHHGTLIWALTNSKEESCSDPCNILG